MIWIPDFHELAVKGEVFDVHFWHTDSRIVDCFSSRGKVSTRSIEHLCEEATREVPMQLFTPVGDDLQYIYLLSCDEFWSIQKPDPELTELIDFRDIHQTSETSIDTRT